MLPASLWPLRNREGIGLSVVLGMLVTVGGVGLTLAQAR